jgi:hypothetical protein
MTAEIIYDAAADAIMEAMGRDATYTTGGVSTNLKVVLDKMIDPGPGGFEGKAWQHMRTIECLLADLGGEPNKGDTFLVGANTYTVKEVLENDDRFVKVAVK